MADKATADRLIKIKEHNGLSYRQFADILGVTEDTATNYATARTAIKIPMAKKLAEYYGIDLGWILTGNGQDPFESHVAEPATTYRTGRAGHSVSSNYHVHIRGLLAPIVQDLPEAVYQLFQVEGSSMEKTLTQGDFLLCRMENVENIVDNRIYVLVIRDQAMRDYRGYL